MATTETLTADSSRIKWTSLGLDARLIRAIVNLKWTIPTLVQAAAIPLALQGKDVLAKAKTGSGKTGAYAVPIIQQLLVEKMDDQTSFAVKALILVPTTELAGQVQKVFEGLCRYCSDQISIYTVTSDQTISNQVPRLAEFPDVLIATPQRLLAHVDAKNVDLSSLKMIVIDEADLVMSFGYVDDLKKIKRFIPKIVQGFLMSATLSDEVTNLKQILLHTPAVLQLEESKEENRLQQFHVNCKEEDKLLLLYVCLKLKLICGKTMVFVNSIDTSYKLKLFLERFSIKSAVLNSELPQNSRYHIIQQFNRGLIEIVIATDEMHEADKPQPKQKKSKKPKKNEQMKEDSDDSDNSVSEEFVMSEDEEGGNSEDGDDSEGGSGDSGFEMSMDSDEEDEKAAMAELGEDFDVEDAIEMETEELKDAPKPKIQKKKLGNKDEEYGVARGIDFKHVANVINYDFPETKENYVHRVGRTARAGEAGIAFSFVCQKDELPLEIVLRHQQKMGRNIIPYVFNVPIVEGFRYRVQCVERTVTKRVVQEARVAEIKREILTSQKLKSHFEENPLDLESLQHDKELQGNKVQRHLAFVPDYLMPTKQELAQTLTPAELAEKIKDEKLRVAYSVRSLKKKGKDPLKTFQRPGKRGRDPNATDKDGRPMKRFKPKKKKAPKRRDKITSNAFKSTKPKPL